MLPELVIGGIALPVVIVALVEVFKAWGLPTQYAPWANGVLSVLGFSLVVYVGLVPEAEVWAVYVVQALVVFLTAAGFYDRAQAVLRRR